MKKLLHPQGAYKIQSATKPQRRTPKRSNRSGCNVPDNATGD